MMKRFLTLFLVLAIASVAPAGIITFQTSNAGPINVGDSVTVSLVADTGVSSVTMGNILGGVVASDNAIYAGLLTIPGFHTPGTLVNNGTTLINKVIGSVAFQAPAVAAGVALYSFTWTATAEGVFLFSTNDNSATFTTTSIGFADGTFTGNAGIGSESITVIPEPISIALLGLGGLFIRRRKA